MKKKENKLKRIGILWESTDKPGYFSGKITEDIEESHGQSIVVAPVKKEDSIADKVLLIQNTDSTTEDNLRFLCCMFEHFSKDTGEQYYQGKLQDGDSNILRIFIFPNNRKNVFEGKHRSPDFNVKISQTGVKSNSQAA